MVFVTERAGARQQYDMFDYFGLFGYRAGTPLYTIDRSVLAGPASFLSFLMLVFRQIVYQYITIARDRHSIGGHTLIAEETQPQV